MGFYELSFPLRQKCDTDECAKANWEVIKRWYVPVH